MRGTSMKHIEKSVPSFARGLPVLLVDHDTSSLTSISSMLQSYSFNVTTAKSTTSAMSIIPNWEHKDRFKLVMAHLSVANPENLFFLRKLVKGGLPVILISSDKNVDDAEKALAEGACLYLEKPIVASDLKYDWQQTCQRRTNTSINISNNSKAQKDLQGRQLKKVPKPLVDRCDKAEANYPQKGTKRPLDGGNHCEAIMNKKLNVVAEKVDSRKGKAIAEEENKENVSKNDGDQVAKKSRKVWTKELHLKFMAALSNLGDHYARPKSILEMMNVPNLTLRQVGSHLQKYKSQVGRISQGKKAGSTLSKKQRGTSTRIGALGMGSFGFRRLFQNDPLRSRDSYSFYYQDLQKRNDFAKPMEHPNPNHSPGYKQNFALARGEGRSEYSPSEYASEKKSLFEAEGTKMQRFEPNTSPSLEVESDTNDFPDLAPSFSTDYLLAEFNLEEQENTSFMNSGCSTDSTQPPIVFKDEIPISRGYDELVRVFEGEFDDFKDLEGKLSHDDVDQYSEWLEELLMAPAEDGSSFYPTHSAKM